MAYDIHQHMLECEARTWLRKGYSTRERTEELAQSITKRRGHAATERLVEEMRRQWRRRSEWLT